MIHRKKRIVIILLICILLLNFTAEPKEKVYSVGASLGAIYGVSTGTKILAFLYASLAAGVTFNALEEAKEMYDKWQMDTNNWEPPVDGGGSNGWSSLLQALIGGHLASGTLQSMMNNIKDWISSIGGVDGENIIPGQTVSSGTVVVNGKTHSYHIWAMPENWNLIFNGVHYTSTNGINYPSTKGHSVSFKLAKPWSSGSSTIQVVGNGYVELLSGDIVGPYEAIFAVPSSASGGIIPPTNSDLSYNITPGGYVSTGNQPSVIVQPNIQNVPGIQEQVSPTGEKQNVYPGTMDDLVNDLVNNTTWDDIVRASQSTTSTPYTLTETQTGIQVDYGEEITTPFPDVDSSPIEDVAEFQGKNIGLLQSIINWLKLIYELPKLLFQIPEGLSIDTSKLRLKDFQLKFPFSIPWDLYKSIKVFAQSPSTPDLTIDINTENLDVNHTIDLSAIDIPLRFARYAMSIFFIIFLAGKTRDLIKW